MRRRNRLVLLILILNLLGLSWSQAQDRCADIFNVERQNAEYFLQQLQSLSDRPYEPEAWSRLGNRVENINDTYLIQLDGFKAVVKFSERAFAFEPLGYEIATRLNIEMPITVPLRMGDHVGMAQVYRPFTATLLDASLYIEPNVAIRFFDRLTLQSDRNSGNVLVEIADPWGWNKNQTPIDHEYMFNSTYSSVKKWRESGPNAFMLEKMPELMREFPEVHQAFLNPQVRNEIVSLVRSQESVTTGEIEYVENFFRTYRNVARIYEWEQ